jgi:TonB family protein
LPAFLGFRIYNLTMGALPTSQPAGIRYSAYIEELREFFATSHLHYGQPVDLVAVTDRLHTSETFFDDLSSLIRSMVLREGGAMAHAQLLEILALAIGGPHMEQAPQHYAQPLRQLLLLITTALRRPWNVPPGEVVAFPSEGVPQAEVVPFPTETADARSDPSADTLPSPIPSPPREPGPMPEPIPIPGPEPTPPAPPAPDFPAEPESAPQATVIAPQATVITPHPVAAALASLSVRTPPAPPSSRRPAPWIYLAGAGAVALALVLAFTLHSTSAPQAGTKSSTQPAVTPMPSIATATAPTAPAAPAPLRSAPAADSKPTAYGAPLNPQPTPRTRPALPDDDETDVAPPTVHNSPGWPPSAASTQAAPGQQSATRSSAYPGLSNSPQSTNPRQPANSASAPVERRTLLGQSYQPSTPQQAYRDPDGSIAGDALPVRPSSSRPPTTREPYFKVSSGVMASNLISDPAPDYPAVARLAHIQGQVILQAVVSRDGTVSATHVLSGHRLLRGAAVDAVRRWRYHPYLMDGHPVDVATIITVDFHR